MSTAFALPYCCACFRRRPLRRLHAHMVHFICELCAAELDDLRRPHRPEHLHSHAADAQQSFPLTSLFEYQGLIRRLVLRAKVQSDHVALNCLCSLVCSSPHWQAAADDAEILVASPSSLWGRWRGRFDLAHALARSTQVNTSFEPKPPLLPAPYPLYWRWRKQARLRARALRALDPATLHGLPLLLQQAWQRRFAQLCRGRRLLLIDDVVTSGGTLLQTASYLRRAAEVDIHFLTLASAL